MQYDIHLNKSSLAISGQVMGWAEKANDAYKPIKSKYYTLLIKEMGLGLAQT